MFKWIKNPFSHKPMGHVGECPQCGEEADPNRFRDIALETNEAMFSAETEGWAGLAVPTHRIRDGEGHNARVLGDVPSNNSEELFDLRTVHSGVILGEEEPQGFTASGIIMPTRPLDPMTVSGHFPSDHSVIHTYDGEISYNTDNVNGNQFIIYGEDTEPLVSVNLNTGEVVLREGADYQITARRFWDTVSRTGATRISYLQEANEHLNEIVASKNIQIDRLEEEIDYLKMRNKLTLDEPDDRFSNIIEDL